MTIDALASVAHSVGHSTFLFDNLVDRLLSPPLQDVLLINGGIATGKTTVLSRLAALETGREPRLIFGRKPTALSELESAAASSDPIYVDDLDAFFDTRAKGVIDRVVSNGTARLRMTTTLPADVAILHSRGAFSALAWDEQRLRTWSDVTMSFVSVPLDPWARGWKRQLCDLVRREVADDATGWATAVLHLSGGHPVLVDAALRYLGSASGDVLRRSTGDVTEEEWHRRILGMEEHLLATGLRRITRAISTLRTLDPDGTTQLERIARSEVPAIKNRRALFASGVVYSASGQPVVLAGELVRRFLAGDDQQKFPSATVSGTSERGEVLITIGGETTSISLRGNSWNLARVLGRIPGAVVGVRDICEATRIDQSAIRAAIQRLKAEIGRAGVDGVIENVRGEGYRLAQFPRLNPARLGD